MYCKKYFALKSDKISFDNEIKLSEKNSNKIFKKLDKKIKNSQKRVLPTLQINELETSKAIKHFQNKSRKKTLFNAYLLYGFQFY
jgi:hypothetical protein